MSVCFQKGSKLTENDLRICIENPPGNPFDPFEIKYTVFDMTTGTPVVHGIENLDPIRYDPGCYYAPLCIDGSYPVGDWKIIWCIKDVAGDDCRYIEERFCVVEAGVYTYGFLANLDHRNRELIAKLRVMLRDNHPDRNYRWRPPNRDVTVAGFTNKFGYIWTDEELFCAIIMALGGINAAPPQTFWTLPNTPLDHDTPNRNLPFSWETVLIISAAMFASRMLEANWIADEFDYNIGGISLSLEKSQKYAGLAESWRSLYELQLESAKKTVKLTRGLRQNPFGIGAILRSGYQFRASTVAVKGF